MRTRALQKQVKLSINHNLVINLSAAFLINDTLCSFCVKFVAETENKALLKYYLECVFSCTFSEDRSWEAMNGESRYYLQRGKTHFLVGIVKSHGNKIGSSRKGGRVLKRSVSPSPLVTRPHLLLSPRSELISQLTLPSVSVHVSGWWPTSFLPSRFLYNHGLESSDSLSVLMRYNSLWSSG